MMPTLVFIGAFNESRCRKGVELRTIWSALWEEELQATGWLDKDRQENLLQDVAGVGRNSTDGSTRGKITEKRDTTRANCINKGLACHTSQDRANRPVRSWLQREKLSSAWLQALPGPDSNLTSAEFSEAAAAALCLASPASMERLGQKVRVVTQNRQGKFFFIIRTKNAKTYKK